MKFSPIRLSFLIVLLEVIFFSFLFFREIRKIDVLLSDLPEIEINKEKELAENRAENGSPPIRQPADGDPFSANFEPSLLSWQEYISSTPWSKRDAHTSVVFNNKIWIMGGIRDGDVKLPYARHIHESDVWTSANGEDWELITDDAAWGERRAHSSVIFQDKIWVLGGWEKKSWEFKNDVWSSKDGINWEEVTDSAPWTARKGHSVVVFKDKIWLIAGVDIKGAKNDVWSSEDGKNWEMTADETPWPKMYDQTVTVFQDKLWLIGGVIPGMLGERKVWSSEDGKDWELETKNPDWQGRHGHCALLFQDRFWILAGWNGMGKGFNDVWYSEDGINWEKFLTESPWKGREDPVCIVFDDKIWIMGGMATSGARLNDIWHLGEINI